MSNLQYVTFFFTDIEGSTRLWEQHPEAMELALARHDEIMRQAIEEHGGHVFKTGGDAFYAVFETAPTALAAALAAQRALYNEPWGETGRLLVRMALHSGPAGRRDGDYFGLTLSRLDRLLRAGHGGQILLSLETQQQLYQSLPDGAGLRDLGEHRLKDLVCLEHIFQCVVPGLPENFPPLRTLDARPTNLPAQQTRFLGREQEVAEVMDLLRRPDVRLVTLTGPGGTGKTRLGLQVAADLLEDLADGVYFVALAPIRDPELVIPTIAHTLDIKERADQDLLSEVKEHLREKEMLLLLDNVEQVVEAAPLLGELLTAVPQLKILATSRTALRLYGEHEYPVPPLPLPNMGQLPEMEDLENYPAIALFVERAQAIRPNFSLSRENASAVAEICSRLDGLPLAIELAAARSKIFSPQAMLARFRGPPSRSSLELLAGGPRDLPARQQTLRGAIDWSYELLSSAERRLFARLGIFVRGCTMDAVEAVGNPGGEAGLDTVDGLLSLVDQSMLRRDEDRSGEPRFTMLETIRDYALERLAEEGDGEVLRQRHAAHYLELVEQVNREIYGPDQHAWLDRLQEEYDNLRAALAWALEQQDPTPLLRLSATLGRFWHFSGYLGEGRHWLDLALEKGLSQQPPTWRAQALTEAGGLAYDHIDYARSRALLEEALPMWQKLGDRAGLADVSHRLGSLATYEGRMEEAQHYLEQALALWQETNMPDRIPSTVNNLGLLAMYQGDLERAMSLHEQSLALFRQQGNRYGEVSSLLLLGYEALQLDKIDQAAARCREALALLGQQRDVTRVIEGLEIYAGVLVAQGAMLKAVQLCTAAERMREQFEIPRPPVDQPLIDQIFSRAQAQEGKAAVDAARAQGQAMTTEEVVRYALS